VSHQHPNPKPPRGYGVIGSLLAFLRIGQLENRAIFRNYIVAPFADDVEVASQRFASLLDAVCLKRS